MSEDANAVPDRALRARLLTVYGRNPVLETLRNENLQCHALHLASSNREGGVIGEMRSLAAARDLPVRMHSRKELSRISRNGRQDQGVALDVLCPTFNTLEGYIEAHRDTIRGRLLALDGVTNPQNLGMIIRSACAGNIDGIVLPRRGTAALGPLVIKASAGSLFRAPVLTCDDLAEALSALKQVNAEICMLASGGDGSLFEHRAGALCVYVVGNESEGVSPRVASHCDRSLFIPMREQVESLNVAVAASLVAFLPKF